MSCVVSVGLDRRLTNNLSFGPVRLNIVEVEMIQMLLIMSVRILDLGIRHAMRISRVIL